MRRRAADPGSELATADADGIGDTADDCPSVYDPLQDDADKDLTGDACDNCPSAFNERSPTPTETAGAMLAISTTETVYVVWSSLEDRPRSEN